MMNALYSNKIEYHIISERVSRLKGVILININRRFLQNRISVTKNILQITPIMSLKINISMNKGFNI